MLSGRCVDIKIISIGKENFPVLSVLYNFVVFGYVIHLSAFPYKMSSSIAVV